MLVTIQNLTSHYYIKYHFGIKTYHNLIVLYFHMVNFYSYNNPTIFHPINIIDLVSKLNYFLNLLIITLQIWLKHFSTLFDLNDVIFCLETYNNIIQTCLKLIKRIWNASLKALGESRYIHEGVPITYSFSLSLFAKLFSLTPMRAIF